MSPHHALLRAVAVLVAAVPAAAAAGHHQICFQVDSPTVYPRVTLAWRSDDPTAFARTIQPAGWRLVSSWRPRGGGNEHHATYEIQQVWSGYTYRATFAFTDGTTRTCSGTIYHHYEGYPPSELLAFMTDDSGLAMTGLWRGPPNETIAPDNFLITGGGQVGAPPPLGTLVVALSPYGFFQRFWWSIALDPLTLAWDYTSYVIGLKIEGVSNLAAAASHAECPGPWGTSSDAACPLPAGQVLVGGGADTYARREPPQPLVLSTPEVVRSSIVGWRGRSASHPGAPTTSRVHAHVIGIPEYFLIGGEIWRVRTAVTSEKSGDAEQPELVVAGKSGFALTSIGAQADPVQGQESWLWKLLPRFDVGGVEVGASDHGTGSRAEVTGHAVGVQLELCGIRCNI